MASSNRILLNIERPKGNDIPRLKANCENVWFIQISNICDVICPKTFYTARSKIELNLQYIFQSLDLDTASF